MAARNMSITEPHPSVPKKGSAYISGGRGGAGNYRKYKAEELTQGQTATGPASKLNLLTKSLKKQNFIPNGRGGSGNMYKPTTDAEERVFQFDEEMARRSESKAPVYHIGRGGAANWVDERSEIQLERMRQGSQASADSASSASTSGSNARRTFSSLTRKISS